MGKAAGIEKQPVFTHKTTTNGLSLSASCLKSNRRTSFSFACDKDVNHA